MKKEFRKCLLCDKLFYRKERCTDFNWNLKRCCGDECTRDIAWGKRLKESGLLERLIVIINKT